MNKYRKTPLLKSTIPGMSDERFTELKEKGQIVTRHTGIAGMLIEGKNGREQRITNKGGTVENTFKKSKMSKKERRKWRKAQFEMNRPISTPGEE